MESTSNDRNCTVKEQVLTHFQILVQEKDLVRRALGEDVSVIDAWERVKSGEFSGTILESQMKQLKSLQGAHYCDGRASKRVPLCSCGSVAVRSEKYDAYYCPEGLVWMTAGCYDPDCEFCRDRPERPTKS
jgi:hypothetical protein